MTHANRRSLRVFTALTALLLAAAVVLSLTDEEAVRPAGAAAAIPVSGDWGLSFQNEGQPPVGNAAQEELAQYGAYYLGNCDEKVIYLTFDCGYENGYTEPILDALKKHNAPAAFFVVGNMVETAPDIIRRMAQEGHIVGNHTYHHPDMSGISELNAFQRELDSLAELYQQPRPWGTTPCSGVWPMWTGTRTTSPRRSRPTASCCPESTTGPLCCSTPPPAPTRRFWTSC